MRMRCTGGEIQSDAFHMWRQNGMMALQLSSLFRMTSFGQMKDLYKIQREAKRIKKDLKNVHVEAEAGPASSLGGYTVKVVVSAEQEIVSIQIAPEASMESAPPLLVDALNRALKKAQVVAAERMQGIMQQMGMPAQAGGMDE